MQKRISLIFLAGMCPQYLSDTGLSALEAKELPWLMNLPFWLAWGERPRSGKAAIPAD